MEQFVTFIIWSAIFQGLFLSGLFFFSASHRSQSNKLLSYFLLALMLEAIPIFLPFDKIGDFYLIAYFRLPEVKLFFGFLFLHYVLKKIGAEKKYEPIFKTGYTIASLVFLLAPVNWLIFLISGNTFSTFIPQSAISTFYMIQQTTGFFLTIIALMVAIYETQKYQNYIKREHSDISLLMIDWLWHFIFLMVPIALLWGAELMRIALGGRGSLSDIVLITWLLVYIAIYYVSYKAFVNGDIFKSQDRLDQVANSSDHVSKIRESHDEMKVILDELHTTMEQEKLFLNSSLTLHDLSKKVSIPSKKISQTINELNQTNFSVWVNQFRVEFAKELLEKYSEGNLSIEGIGNQAGFKSRSAMYMAFKKITGKSPGDFKG